MRSTETRLKNRCGWRCYQIAHRYVSLQPLDSPDASGLRAVGCAQVAAKRGIHGLSPCCALCHGTDGLQKVYIDNEPTTLCCIVITEIMLRWPSTVRYAT